MFYEYLHCRWINCDTVLFSLCIHFSLLMCRVLCVCNWENCPSEFSSSPWIIEKDFEVSCKKWKRMKDYYNNTNPKQQQQQKFCKLFFHFQIKIFSSCVTFTGEWERENFSFIISFIIWLVLWASNEMNFILHQNDLRFNFILYLSV